MGYQTDFQLTFDATDDVVAEVFSALEKISRYRFDDWYLYGAKWYDHDRDMKTLSLAYPDILFTLEGKGDESDDLWISYYQNGKSQHCQAEIVYPEYDARMMR
jgi:hypothetical protein